MNEHATTGWSSDMLPPSAPSSSASSAARDALDALDAPESAAPSLPTPPPPSDAHGATAAGQRSTRPPKGGRRVTGQRGGEPAPDGSDDDLTSTRKRKRVARKTDSGLIPAFRFNHYVGREYATRKPAVVYDTEHVPSHLRVTRLLIGVILLAAAWATALLVAVLTESLIDVFPNQPSLTIRFGLYILGAIGLAWLAVVALALIIVGAFSLTLALTRRQW